MRLIYDETNEIVQSSPTMSCIRYVHSNPFDFILPDGTVSYDNYSITRIIFWLPILLLTSQVFEGAHISLSSLLVKRLVHKLCTTGHSQHGLPPRARSTVEYLVAQGIFRQLRQKYSKTNVMGFPSHSRHTTRVLG